LMPGDCEPFPPATVPIYASRDGQPIGELRGSGRPATATVCEFPDVRAVIGPSSFDIATDEHGYEERALIVTATAPGWYRVFTGGRPERVWIKATPRSVYRRLKELFAESLTYLTADWDRRLYARPFGSFTRAPRPGDADATTEQTVDVHEVTVVKGVYWARVSFVAGCDARQPTTQGHGWVRVHRPAPAQSVMLWFYSRGC
jgi:hypothetical protein